MGNIFILSWLKKPQTLVSAVKHWFYDGKYLWRHSEFYFIVDVMIKYLSTAYSWNKHVCSTVLNAAY